MNRKKQVRFQLFVAGMLVVFGISGAVAQTNLSALFADTTSTTTGSSGSAPTIPNPPQDLRFDVSPTSNTIFLKWTDASSNEDKFYIDRKLTADANYAGTLHWAEVTSNVTNFSDTNTTAGQRYDYRIQACNAQGCSAYASLLNVVIPNACMSLSLTLTDNKNSSYVVGDMVNYAYNCSPEGASATSITIQVVKPDGTATTYVTGNNVGAVVQKMGFSTSNLTAGSYVLRACLNDTSCSAGSTYPVSFTVTAPATSTTPATTSGSCANGSVCSSTSYCSNGQKYYYPNGDITCVAWPTSPGPMTAPAGTSSCSPTDKSCISAGGYGPSTGWCSQGMKFYQKDKDTNPNNDIYCAENTHMAPGATYVEPTPPSGYTSCESTSTTCRTKGDSWAEVNSSFYCMNSQKCNLPSGGGSCVGWNEQCPTGSKFCNSTDQNCVEPGEYKTFAANSTNNSFWCGGGGGMMFWSSTQGYCAPKKAGTTTGTTMGMMTAGDIKEILTKLGAGWGLCRPSDTNCIEPGKTGSSSGWCAWYAPGNYMPSTMMGTGSVRTCPSLDEGTTNVSAKVEPVKPEPAKPTEMIKIDQTVKPEITIDPQKVPMPPSPELVTPVPPEFQMTQSPYQIGFDQCRMMREQNRNSKYEISRFQNTAKKLPSGIQAPQGFTDAVAKAKAGYEDIERTLAAVARGKCSQEVQDSARQKMNALLQVMTALRDQGQVLEVYGRCNDFQKGINDRIKTLNRDAKRIDFAEELSALADLTNRSKDVCKNGDEFGVQDLEFDRGEIEQAINDKYEEAQQDGESSFFQEAISGIRNGIKNGRNKITKNGLENSEKCSSLNDLFTQIDGFLTEASSAYEEDDREAAGSAISKAASLKDIAQGAAKQCGIGIEFHQDGDATNVFQSGDQVDQKVIDRINEIVSKKIEIIFDEFNKQLTTKVAQLTEKMQERVQASLDALAALPKDNKATEDVKKAKTAIIDTIGIAEIAAQKLPSRIAGVLHGVLERAASKNWCGKYADSITSATASFRTRSENNDLTADDIAALDQAVTAAERQNNAECYALGLSKFKDADTSAWYFEYFQKSNAFKGSADGSVEPGRETLRAEALIAIERAAGIEGVDGKTCTLTASAQGVPEWANCAVNVAYEKGIRFNEPLNTRVTRDEVALWVDTLTRGELPVSDDAEFTSRFSDIKSCQAQVSVSKMVGNQIMTGANADGTGKWGCRQPLVRAELAAILARLGNLLELTK
ncbi:MAG: hypothetical protein AAB551_00540 [Patescibacteria group bacterium]